MEKLTFIELAKRILEEEKKPLSATNIWEIAKQKGYATLLHSQGKTPWATLGAQLYCNVRDRKDSPFIKVGTRPKLFHLKKLVQNDELNLIEQAQDETTILPKQTEYLEKDLHPFLT
ncbi:MAG: winged helix-turn-helix domain-containing protein, partial [Spirochaetota bacterium]